MDKELNLEVDTNSNEIHRSRSTIVTFIDTSETLNKLSCERDKLLNDNFSPSHVRPRMSSVFFMVDSRFAGGITSRANYMTRCFMCAWEGNHAAIPQLYMLLWNGESSRQVLWKAVLGLLLQWFLALLPSILFIDVINKNIVIIWVIFCAELVSILWNIFVLLVLQHNKKTWVNAWFTYEVPFGTIGLVDPGRSAESSLTLFHSSANIRFSTVNYSNIWKLYTISKHEQDVLEKQMKSKDLREADIILYTNSFLNCYSNWPLRMTFALLFFYIAGFFLCVYWISK